MGNILTHSPADVIASLLVDNGVTVAASTGNAWSTFIDTEPDAPDNCVTIYNTSGRLLGRTHVDKEVQLTHGIQIRVRATTNPVGYSKMSAISEVCDAVARGAITLDAIDYLVHSMTRSSDVLSLGKLPETNRSIFTINYLLSITKEN